MKVWIYEGNRDDWLEPDDVYATLEAACRALNIVDPAIEVGPDGLRVVHVGDGHISEFGVQE